MSTPSWEGCGCTPFESRWYQRHGECIVVSSDADAAKERVLKFWPASGKTRRTTRLSVSNTEGLNSLCPGFAGRLDFDEAFGGFMGQSGSCHPFPLFVAAPVAQFFVMPPVKTAVRMAFVGQPARPSAARRAGHWHGAGRCRVRGKEVLEFPAWLSREGQSATCSVAGCIQQKSVMAATDSSVAKPKAQRGSSVHRAPAAKDAGK